MADKTDAPNEIVAETRAAAAIKDAAAAKPDPHHARRWPIAGIGLGLGIGSAAIAAAVLYANRSRDKS